MKLNIKTVALSALSIALSSAGTVQAGGCGHRGGGVSIGIGGGGISIGGIGIGGGHIARQPSMQMPTPIQHRHVTPSYPQHVYSQPNYIPSNPQPVYSQPSPQPVYQQSGYPQPTYSQGSSQPIQSQVVQSQMPSQQMNGQPMNGSQMGMQQQPQMMNQNQAATQQAGYAQQAPQQQPAGGNLAAQSMPTANAAPQGQLAVAAAPSNAALPTGNSNGQAAMSALQMLASMNSPTPESDAGSLDATAMLGTQEVAAAAMQAAPSNAGTWQVALPGNQTITLVLGADGNFQWNAVKEGKSNSFQGQYRMEGGRLTLVRSNDLQQMTGSWNDEGGKSVFKLDGAKDSGLAFARVQ